MNEVRKLHPQAEVVAILLATGKYRVDDVARLANVNPKSVYAWQENEHFQALFLRHQEKYRQEMRDEAIEELRRDHPTNVTFLQAVRDGKYAGEDSKMLKVRLEAARTIADEVKTHAKRVDKEPPRHFHFSLPASEQQRIGEAMAEDAIEVEPVEEPPEPDDAA